MLAFLAINAAAEMENEFRMLFSTILRFHMLLHVAEANMIPADAIHNAK